MNSSQRRTIVCIGSNCGDRIGNVSTALVRLAGILEDFRHSSIYATPDCHGGEREYYNAVCIGISSMAAQELETFCKQIELEFGRDSAARKRNDVPLDVDIVVFGGELLRERDFKSEFFQIGYKSINNNA